MGIRKYSEWEVVRVVDEGSGMVVIGVNHGRWIRRYWFCRLKDF